MATMSCLKCNDVSTPDDAISCDGCDNTIHYKCLYLSLPDECRSQNMPKYFRASFSLPNIVFKCDVCTNTNLSTGNTFINDKLNKLQVGIESLTAQLSSFSPYSNDSTILESLSSAISSLPDALNKSTTKSFSAIVKSNLPPSPSTSTLLNPPTIHSCASKPSIIIEHILPADRNLTYIKSLFAHLQLDPITITDYSFISHYANLVLSSSCATDTLIKSRSLLQSSTYKSLFIRKYIDPPTIKAGRILFHASKAHCHDLKCVFNRRTLTYQLRSPLTSGRIDWKSNPYLPTDVEIESWSKSYDSFCKSSRTNVKPSN